MLDTLIVVLCILAATNELISGEENKTPSKYLRWVTCLTYAVYLLQEYL